MNRVSFVYFISNAPPHGVEYSDGCTDNYPDGCPCKFDFDEMLETIDEKNIRFKFVKIGNLTNIF